MPQATKLADELIEYLQRANAWWKWENHRRYAILSSGKYSDFYVNCTPILMNPPLLQRVGFAMADHVRDTGHHLWIFGPAYGGIALAHQIAMKFPGGRAGFAEKTTDSPDLRTVSRFVEFFDAPPRVLFCEDVVTTLSSVMKMKEAFEVQCPNATILPEVLCIVNRSGEKEIKGFKISSLIDVDAKVWDPKGRGADLDEGVYPKKNWKLLNEKKCLDKKDPVLKGTVVRAPSGLVVEVLEDTTAHGCPKVKILEESPQCSWKKGDETFMTLYLHTSAMSVVFRSTP